MKGLGLVVGVSCSELKSFHGVSKWIILTVKGWVSVKLYEVQKLQLFSTINQLKLFTFGLRPNSTLWGLWYSPLLWSVVFDPHQLRWREHDWNRPDIVGTVKQDYFYTANVYPFKELNNDKCLGNLLMFGIWNEKNLLISDQIFRASVSLKKLSKGEAFRKHGFRPLSIIWIISSHMDQLQLISLKGLKVK